MLSYGRIKNILNSRTVPEVH